MSEWANVTLEYLSNQRKGINYKSEDYADEDSGHPFITIKCFVKGGGYEPTGIKFYDGFSTKADHLSPGDVLFAVTDLTRAGDIVGSPLRVPDFGSDKPALASMDCMRIEPVKDRCDKGFLYHRLMLSDVRRQMVAYSAGSTVLHLDTKKVPSMVVRVPLDIRVQRLLASILDAIDRTIESTEALIEKHQQIKAGLMHDLFTRGIGADGKLRPPRAHAPELYQQSTIGWIPKDWRVMPLGEVFSVQLGKMLSRASKTGKHEFKYLGNKDVQWDKVDTVDLGAMDFSPTEREKFSLAFGDLLVCEGGEVGRTAMWRNELENCYFQKAIHRLRPIGGEVLPAYMLRFMFYAKSTGMLNNYTSQTSIAHLTREKLLAISVLVPQVSEQVQLVREFEAIDGKLAAEQELLAKLRQQKSGLMHDLLTGERAVRVAAEPAKAEAHV